MSKKLDYLVWGNPQLGAKNKKVTVNGSSFRDSYVQKSLPSLDENYEKQNPSVKMSIFLRDYKFLADALIEIVKKDQNIDIDIPTAFALLGFIDYAPPIINQVITPDTLGNATLSSIYHRGRLTLSSFIRVIHTYGEFLNRMQLEWVAGIVKKALIQSIENNQTRVKRNYSDRLKAKHWTIIELILKFGADLTPYPDDRKATAPGGVYLSQFMVLADYGTIGAIRHAFEIAKLNDFKPILQYNFSGKTVQQVLEEIAALERQMAVLSGSEFGNPMDADDAGEPVVKFPDGLAWYRIRESYSEATAEALGHCGNRHHPGDDDEVWNLGKKMKDGRVRPAITFIVTMPKGGDRGGIVGEMKGKANSTPAEPYHKYIYGLFESPYIGYVLGGGHSPNSNFNPDRDFKDEYKAKWRSLLAQKPYLRKATAYRDKFGEAYYDVLNDEAFDDWKFYNDSGRDPHGWNDIHTYEIVKISKFFEENKPWSERSWSPQRTGKINPVIDYIEYLTSDPETQDECFTANFGYIPKFSWAKFGEGVLFTGLDKITSQRIKDFIIKQLSTRYDSGMLNANEKHFVYQAIAFIKKDLWSELDNLSASAYGASYTIKEYLPDGMIELFNASVHSGYFDGTLYHLQDKVKSYCNSVFEDLPGKVKWDFELESFDDGGDITWDTSDTGEENCSDGFSASDIDEYAHEQGRFDGPSHDDCYSPVDISEYEHDYKYMDKVNLIFDPYFAAQYLERLTDEQIKTLSDAWAQKRFL